MKTITKADLAAKISSKLGFSQTSCEDIVSEIFQQLLNITATKGDIYIKNFGGFKLFTKAPRPGRNISKNESVLIEEKQVIRFSASRTLRNQMNNIKNIVETREN